MPTTLIQNQFLKLELQVARQKTNHIQINNTDIPFFSYLIRGTYSKRNGGSTHNKQLIPAAELNNKQIIQTTTIFVTTIARPTDS